MKRTIIALLPLLLSLTLPATADVQERLQEQFYDLQVASGQSLSRAINQASPIRQNGQNKDRPRHDEQTTWRFQQRVGHSP